MHAPVPVKRTVVPFVEVTAGVPAGPDVGVSVGDVSTQLLTDVASTVYVRGSDVFTPQKTAGGEHAVVFAITIAVLPMICAGGTIAFPPFDMTVIVCDPTTKDCDTVDDAWNDVETCEFALTVHVPAPRPNKLQPEGLGGCDVKEHESALLANEQDDVDVGSMDNVMVSGGLMGRFEPGNVAKMATLV